MLRLDDSLRLADGWRPGMAPSTRLFPRGVFSHVVAYIRQISALRGWADTDTGVTNLLEPVRVDRDFPNPSLKC